MLSLGCEMRDLFASNKLHSSFINCLTSSRSSRSEVFCKKDTLRNSRKFTGKHLWQSLFFNKVAGPNFIKRETLAQVSSCEFSGISKNSFSHRTPLVAASGHLDSTEKSDRKRTWIEYSHAFKNLNIINTPSVVRWVTKELNANDLIGLNISQISENLYDLL